MASVKNLKKEINYVLGDIVNIVYIWETRKVVSEGILDTIENFKSKLKNISI
jgi:hypothetical protein